MTYRVQIERIDETGVPTGPSQVFEARNEAEAVTIAAFEIDGTPIRLPGIATVSDGAGRLVFTYTGRVAGIRR